MKPAIVPSGELKIIQPFKVELGDITTLVIDFDADSSVNVTGNQEIHVKPVIKLAVK